LLETASPPSSVKSIKGKDRSRNTKASQTRSLAAATDFEKFWSVWPHKVAREDAVKAFFKVRSEVDAIVAGVERYVRDKPPSQNWLSPATFLNGRRWEDVPAPVAAGPPSRLTSSSVADLINYSKEVLSRERQENQLTGQAVRLLPELPS
jgi:hypothetical protein